MNAISVVSPITGLELHSLTPLSAAQVALEFADAKAEQPSWNALGAKQRSKIAARLADLLAQNAEQVMDQLQLETGKSRSHAFEEITGA